MLEQLDQVPNYQFNELCQQKERKHDWLLILRSANMGKLIAFVSNDCSFCCLCFCET
jgi:hypothetical protein